MIKRKTIGASHGWIATLKDDGILRLQDDLNPYASDTNPKRIPLPPLVTLPHCQTKITTNVSMSSSSPEDDEDCVVAVKFLGPQLSFCRPAESKPEWTSVKLENPCFHSSRVMFSKKDKQEGALCGQMVQEDNRDDQKWRSHNEKESSKVVQVRRGGGRKRYASERAAERDFLDSFCKSEHLVESPTGETFLVEQYKKKRIVKEGVARMRREFLIVYKLDNEGTPVYTQDMGDVTMFLSKSEPFCVPSTSFPGLRRNYIHILDVDEIVGYDVGDISIAAASGTFYSPYYFPPVDN
ncbi:uncharacterized protein LOC106420907 [Brassica napus]|uniref:uncharacterized protein LOC106420907 n=1 Tax=Brassica napus TaxID=3708 RepID=UPI000BBE3C12|nr:uncharacterized protein LOC106420907 [Brassica napus]